MYRSKRLTSVICVLFLSIGWVSAQNFPSVFPEKTYPKDQFKSPVDFPIYLAGNYGECRPNHFHSGLDIKTQQVENKKVRSIDFGFVSRIKISSTGFGNALYISHPNGYTSLYAHLNSFSPMIQSVVEYYQYTQKKWDIDVQLPFWMLIVMQGDQIALSGNTGSSLAPHLHLEIRDSETEKTLNPWLFGFKIEDHKAPVVQSLGVYNLEEDANFYEQSPEYLPTKDNGNSSYSISKSLKLKNQKVGFSIRATDFIDKNSGKLGVYETQMYVDGELYFAWQVDNIGYDETRYLHAFADYIAHKKKNQWYECAFRLPGNHLDIYHDPAGKDGVLDISDGNPHSVEFRLYDVLGNKSTLKLQVQYAGTSDMASCSEPFRVDKVNEYEDEDMLLMFPKTSFYDGLCFNAYQDGAQYSIGNPMAPVHDYFRFSAGANVADADVSKMVMALKDEDGELGKAAPAEYHDGRLICNGFREFGKFQILKDTDAPKVSTNLADVSSLGTGQWIKVKAEDDMTYVKYINLYANGKWLCMIRKKNNYRYRIDRHCPRGNVEFKLVASDANDNTTTKTYKIKIQ